MRSLCFYATPASGRGGLVMEVRPAAASAERIECREWGGEHAISPDEAWTASTTTALDQRLRTLRREGWRLSESPEFVLGWLRAAAR